MDRVSIQLDITSEVIVATDLDNKEVLTFVKDTQLEEEFEIIKYLLLQLQGVGVYGPSEKLGGKVIMDRTKRKFGEEAVKRLLLAYTSDE